MRLTNKEKETILNFNEGENTASVCTYNRAMRNRLKRLAEDRPDECRLYQEGGGGQAAGFHIPKTWIKISPPRKLSEEQKAKLREASARTRFTSKSGS